MSIILALAATASLSPSSSPTPAALVEESQRRAEIESVARRFLMLVDDSRWGESFDATSESFKRLNTNKAWMEASQQARVPLGPMLSRTVISNDSVPVPQAGLKWSSSGRTSPTRRTRSRRSASCGRKARGAWRGFISTRGGRGLNTTP